MYFNAGMNDPKYKKNTTNSEIIKANMTDDAKNFIDRFLGDVSKTSATKQIAIGAGSGW